MDHMTFQMQHSLFLHTVFYDSNINWALTSNHLERITRFEPLSSDFIHHLGSVGANSRAWDLGTGENLILTNQDSRWRAVGNSKTKEHRAKSHKPAVTHRAEYSARVNPLFCSLNLWFGSFSFSLPSCFA